MGVSAGRRRARGSLYGSYLFFLSLAILVINARGQPCSSNTKVPREIASKIITDKCQDAWTTANWNYTLRFKQNTAANTLSVILTVNKVERWFGMGFSSLNDVPTQMTIPDTQNQHESMITYNINYQTGAVTAKKDNTNTLRRSHGILNVFGWGILLPFGVIIARYARRFDPAWFYTHAGLQSLVYILIAAGFGLGLKTYKRLRGADHLYAHKVIGIILFILATLQILAGIIRPKREAKVRRIWNWGHCWLGRSALVLAAVNIFVGIHAAGGSRKWKIGYGVVLGLELLLLIPLETLYWLNYRKKAHDALPPDAGHKSDLESSVLDSTAPGTPAATEGEWDAAKY